ncbi:unnamed protein product, partial [Cladocopium goreaui]
MAMCGSRWPCVFLVLVNLVLASCKENVLIRRDVAIRHDGKFDLLKRPEVHHAKHGHAKRLSTKKRGEHAQHAISHLKVDEMKEIPNCREEYTCDAHRTRSLGDYARKHIAVYTYNIGSYEGGMRDDNVPCVPSNVDAFLFLDDDTKERTDSNSLNLWKKLGWQVKSVTLQAGSEFVTGARLTSKLLKFTPPSWLLNGEWEWLVEFDGNVVLDLHTLGPFLDKYSSKPLLLLDWSYHEDCGDDGFQCFSHELHNMLHARRKYIEDSKENVEAWERKLAKEHDGTDGTRLSSSGRTVVLGAPRCLTLVNKFRFAEHDTAYSKKAIKVPVAPSQSTARPTDSNLENKYNRLLAALEKQENSEEVQQLVEEGSVKTASSRQMHTAVKKLDQARDKYHVALKARQNLHESWTKYLDESIKRWTTFAEDFGKKDRELETKVQQTKEKLQEARQCLDETKEQLSNRDKDLTKEDELMESEMDEEQSKVETSERILAGINAMVQNLEAVRVRPPDDINEHAAKKARTESTEAGAGVCQAPIWTHSIVSKDIFVSEWKASIKAIDLAFELGCSLHDNDWTIFKPVNHSRRRRQLRFATTVDLYVGPEDTVEFGKWPHALEVPYHRASIFHHDWEVDYTSFMAHHDVGPPPVQERVPEPQIIDQGAIAVNVEVTEDEALSEDSWSADIQTRSSWRTTLIFALRRQATTLRLDWREEQSFLQLDTHRTPALQDYPNCLRGDFKSTLGQDLLTCPFDRLDEELPDYASLTRADQELLQEFPADPQEGLLAQPATIQELYQLWTHQLAQQPTDETL